MLHVKNSMEQPWNSSQILKYSKAILLVEGKGYSYKCFNIRIDLEEIISLCSNQEESDTCFILYENNAKMIGFKNVVIRSSDTDVFLFLLYYACDIDALLST